MTDVARMKYQNGILTLDFESSLKFVKLCDANFDSKILL